MFVLLYKHEQNIFWGKNLSELPAMFVWGDGWRLPDGFKSKKEWRIFLGKNDYVIKTDEHYSKKNSWHYDVFQYGSDGQINKKLHFKIGDDDLLRRFTQCFGKP